MKLRIQAQHLQPGDIVGSGEKVNRVIINSIQWRSNEVMVELYDGPEGATRGRQVLWGKYTMINVERKTLEEKYESGLTDEDLEVDEFGP